MDDYVWNFVQKICERPEVLQEAIAQRQRILEAEQTDFGAEVERLQEQLDELGIERQWVITQARKQKLTEEDMDMQIAGLQIQE
ncbi:MAG: hypothetical protein DPW09_42705 [Anaerolineae bacterium]|nr:hypothetical protein [Anaerolineae bacterium]